MWSGELASVFVQLGSGDFLNEQGNDGRGCYQLQVPVPAASRRVLQSRPGVGEAWFEEPAPASANSCVEQRLSSVHTAFGGFPRTTVERESCMETAWQAKAEIFIICSLTESVFWGLISTVPPGLLNISQDPLCHH